MTAAELINALEEGRIITKDYAIAYPDKYEYTKPGECVAEYFMDRQSRTIEKRGWGSAYGNSEKYLADMFKNPNHFQLT